MTAPGKERRTEVRSVWMTRAELGDVTSAAQEAGVPVSHVLRGGALNEARRILGGRKCRHCGERG